jgi:AcrR family transcriptional regulator/DNA-binding MarR family transcriptional regulator
LASFGIPAERAAGRSPARPFAARGFVVGAPTLTRELTVALTLEAPSRPRGRHDGAPGTHVTQLHRSRLISALISLVEEEQDTLPTTAQVVGRARVSRKTFYDHFCDREDCFLAAFEDIFSRAQAISAKAYQAEDSWRDGVRAALACLLELIDQHPTLARLCLVTAPAAGMRVQLRRDELMLRLADTIDLGRAAAPPQPRQLSHMTAEAIVGGINAVLHRRLVLRDRARFVELLGPLMGMIVLPYLGPRAAGDEELRVYHPLAPKPRRPPSKDPLSGISIRLTYRTVRVLVAIAEHPSASNRVVAELAGMTDQGQVSKLLARLARLGLIVNRGEGQARGACNAWSLTEKGEQLERATRPQVL